MGIFEGLLNGFYIALTPVNLLFAFLGALLGTAVGVLPGLGPAATIALLLPVAYNHRLPGDGHHPHGRHLLRFHVRRLHHFDSPESPRRSGLGRNLHRRLQNGPKGARGCGPRHCGHRFFRGGHPCGRRPHLLRSPHRGIRVELRPSREMRPRPGRPPHGGHPLGFLHREGPHPDGAGTAFRLGGNRSHLGKDPVLPSASRNSREASIS